jgi:dihydrofolate reductase
MTKCSVFIATSLDGFISRTDGSLDWLERANRAVPKGEDLGYARFMSMVEGIVLGRTTFEQVLTYEKWPYGAIPLFVLSRTLKSLPAHVPASVSLSAEDPVKLVARLVSQGLDHLYVDGGKCIQSFLAAGLIDELTITLIPVLIGNGNPLFGLLPGDVRLELLSSQAYDFGYVQSTYRIVMKHSLQKAPAGPS